MPESSKLLQLPYRVAPGAAQMAADAALLGWAAAGRARAVFRVYGWARPTLSLGRAEPFPGRWDLWAIEGAGIDVARRPTGGDGVLHDGEMTFAIAASLPGPWGLGPRAFADRVAGALAEALRRVGLTDAGRIAPTAPADRRGHPGARRTPSAPGEVACFARAQAGEVGAGGYKVAGIASRFTRGAALTHASVPLSGGYRGVAALRRDRLRDHVLLESGARSASELLGAPPDETDLARRLVEAIAAALGASVRDAAFEEIGVTDPGGPRLAVEAAGGRGA